MKKRVFPGLLLIFLGLVSYDKVIFAFRLAKASVLQPASPDRRDGLFAEYFHKNRMLRGLPGLAERESFLLPYAESLWVGSFAGQAPGPAGDLVLPALVKKYPDNPFLEAAGFYGQEPGNGDWENLDSLSFRLISNPDRNPLSFAVIADSAAKGRFSPAFLETLIDFLCWRRNFDLSSRLLAWARKRGFVDAGRAEDLSRDIGMRQGTGVSGSGRAAGGGRPDPAALAQGLAGAGLSVSVGRNLIREGILGEEAVPVRSWDFSDMSDGGPFAKGSFFGGTDEAFGGSLRIICFFTKSEPEKENPRAGFWHKGPILLDGNQSYLLHFRYLTKGTTEKPSFYVQYAFGREWALEQAASAWREVDFLFDNTAVHADRINFLLRMAGTGSVWFDEIGFYPLGEDLHFSEEHLLFIR